jgi:hypothetical protein
MGLHNKTCMLCMGLGRNIGCICGAVTCKAAVCWHTPHSSARFNGCRAGGVAGGCWSIGTLQSAALQPTVSLSDNTCDKRHTQSLFTWLWCSCVTLSAAADSSWPTCVLWCVQVKKWQALNNKRYAEKRKYGYTQVRPATAQDRARETSQAAVSAAVQGAVQHSAARHTAVVSGMVLVKPIADRRTVATRLRIYTGKLRVAGTRSAAVVPDVVKTWQCAYAVCLCTLQATIRTSQAAAGKAEQPCVMRAGSNYCVVL